MTSLATQPLTIKNLWRLSYPMMLTAMSTHLMMFADRLILSRYDPHAMGTAATMMMIVGVYQFSVMGVAFITEVYVGQHNGARQYRAIGPVIWQMIWFSIAISLVVGPIMWTLRDILIPHTLHHDVHQYFAIMLTSCVFTSTLASLSGFYVGRGEPGIITRAAVLANVLNIIFNWVLVFGIKGVIPAFGLIGSALGTLAAQCLQTSVLFAIFLRKKHREEFGTGQFALKFSQLIQQLKTGVPNAMSHMLEVGAWAVLFTGIAHFGPHHLAVVTIPQSFIFLSSFFNEGLKQGVIAYGANLLGAGQANMMPKLLNKGIALMLIIAVVSAFPMLVRPDLLVGLFVEKHQMLDAMIIATRWVWVFACLDGMAWVVAGVLTAAGDTRWVMIINGISTWALALAPVYLFAYYIQDAPEAVMMFTAIYAGGNALLLYWRYRTNKWRQIHLI